MGTVSVNLLLGGIATGGSGSGEGKDRGGATKVVVKGAGALEEVDAAGELAAPGFMLAEKIDPDWLGQCAPIAGKPRARRTLREYSRRNAAHCRLKRNIDSVVRAGPAPRGTRRETPVHFPDF